MIGASAPEYLQPFADKMGGFLTNAAKQLNAQVSNLEECKTKFVSTMQYYHFKPKSGTLEALPPSDFFDLWFQFCKDFKDIWKKEIIRMEKEK